MSIRLERLSSAVVGSTNPVKIGAALAVLARLSPAVSVHGVAVPSGVPDQPWGDDETIRGARARAIAALERDTAAELAVGIEGGVVEGAAGGLRTCAWAVAVGRDGREGIGGSLSMALPHSVAELVRSGMELGHAMDAVTGRHDVKRGLGAVGILTAGLVTRQGAYETLVAYALSPFIAG